jgi:hypothetical protein
MWLMRWRLSQCEKSVMGLNPESNAKYFRSKFLGCF